MTIVEFNQQYNDALDSFSAFRLRAVTGQRWGMTTQPVSRTSKLLWLYMNALTRYDPASQNNHLTEEQVQFIVEQVKTLAGTINGPVYS
jgi:hypothetical protein